MRNPVATMQQFATPQRNFGGRRDSHQSVQGSDAVNEQVNMTPHGMHLGMDPVSMYCQQENYATPFSSPQEVHMFNNPNYAATTANFALQSEYPIQEDFHHVRHDQVEYAQAGMPPNAFIATPGPAFDGQFNHPSPTNGLIALAGTPNVIRAHAPPSPASSSHRGQHRWTPYANKPKNKRTGVACDPCRAKKQKCDGVQEGKGCQQCTTNNIECKYREVPPKTSGNPIENMRELILQSTQEISRLTEKLEVMSNRIQTLEQQLRNKATLCQNCSQSCNHLGIKSDSRTAVSPRL